MSINFPTNTELLSCAKLCKHNITMMNPQPLQRGYRTNALAHIDRVIVELERRIKLQQEGKR